jgi:hypothetical protein
MSRRSFAVPALGLCLASALTLVPRPAKACGGFFCNNVTPVVQTAERILFRVNDDCTITTVVEVQYEGPPGNFGWILPVPEVIEPDDIGTAPPGLFDTLEEHTAPVFVEETYEDGGFGGDGAGSGEEAGCGMDWGGPSWGGDGDSFTPSPPDTSGVEVVGEAEVGPYAVEIITAEQGDNLSNWLLQNGYQIPQSAAAPMQHYIDNGASFIGLKLQPDTPAGPIDALTFTFPGKVPSIPLILTAVACAPELEVIAYVAAPTRYQPGNYEDLDFDFDRVGWVGDDGETDYEVWLRADVAASGGQAWNTEFARPLHTVPEFHHAGLDELLPRDLYLTRFHNFMAPADMTADPYWQPANLSDVYRTHTIGGEEDWEGDRPSRTPDYALGLVLPALIWVRRRRRCAS